MVFLFEKEVSNVICNNRKTKIFVIQFTKDQRKLSKFLKKVQSKSYISVELTPFPKHVDYAKYNTCDDIYESLRWQIMKVIKELLADGHVIVAQVTVSSN